MFCVTVKIQAKLLPNGSLVPASDAGENTETLFQIDNGRIQQL